MTAGGALYAMGNQVAGGLHGIMAQGLALTRDQALNPEYMLPTLTAIAWAAVKVCMPILGLIMLAAILAPLVLGGWSFSTEALMPKFSRLNPLAGVKRMVSSKAAVELGKALAKFGVVGVIAIIVLHKQTPALLALGAEPTAAAVGHAIRLCGQGLLFVSSGMLLIAGFDVPYQLWQYAQQLKMTKQEVRQEMKESEGSPELKGHIRRMQREIASRRMMQEVPKADVIVTNPTHFAVALRYDEKRMRAPVVVAKGADLIAARIREIAGEHKVPIFEAPPLARVLYKHVDIGSEVPATVYVAVAQVLSYIFQLRTARKDGAPPPSRPTVDVAEY